MIRYAGPDFLDKILPSRYPVVGKKQYDDKRRLWYIYNIILLVHALLLYYVLRRRSRYRLLEDRWFRWLVVVGGGKIL